MASWPKPETVPNWRVAKLRSKLLGKWGALCKLKERYRKDGLSSREALIRAYREENIGVLWVDYRKREYAAKKAGSPVPLTPAETREILPNYQPLTAIVGAEVGEQSMSTPEAVQWAMHEIAMVRNGSAPPQRFPCKEVLFWFQAAVRNDSIWEKAMLRFKLPTGEQEHGPKDGEAEFAEAERQIKEAMCEVGEQMSAYESGESETRDEVLSADAEGSGL